MRGGGYYVFIMSRCPDVCPDVPMSHTNISIFFRSAGILDGFRWDLGEVITTFNTWTDYIVGEIAPRTTEVWIDVKSVLPRSEWFYIPNAAFTGLHYTCSAERARSLSL